MVASKGQTRKSRTYLILIVASVLYIGAYYLLMQQTKFCNFAEDKVAISSHWFYGFWDQFLACRSINELGDALAGAFAPIAFVWLAGTVFIQSKELEAQRQELDETQEVMREQLEVARQQVKETRASTELFMEQTRILKRQQDQRDAEIADQEFASAFEALKAQIKDYGHLRLSTTQIEQVKGIAKIRLLSGVKVTIEGKEPDKDQIWVASGSTVALLETSSIEERSLHDICREIRARAAMLLSRTKDKNILLFPQSNGQPELEAIEGVKSLLKQLQIRAESVSTSQRFIIDASRVAETIDALGSLMLWWEAAKQMRESVIISHIDQRPFVG